MPRSTKSKGAKPRSSKVTLPKPADFRAYLLDKAQMIAPGDVSTIVAQRNDALERVSRDHATHPRLARQTDVALRLLKDHDSGECPQVPYHTIALLAVALFYLLNPIDVVPDWIPGLGTSDDALVLELGFELAAPGIERYCTWKGISTDGLFTKPK